MTSHVHFLHNWTRGFKLLKWVPRIPLAAMNPPLQDRLCRLSAQMNADSNLRFILQSFVDSPVSAPSPILAAFVQLGSISANPRTPAAGPTTPTRSTGTTPHAAQPSAVPSPVMVPPPVKAVAIPQRPARTVTGPATRAQALATEPDVPPGVFLSAPPHYATLAQMVTLHASGLPKSSVPQ